MKIDLHIERLILEGLPITSGQRSQVQAAVETELTRLLTANGVSTNLLSGGVWPRIPVGSIQLTNDNTPANLGRQIAQAVYKGIGGTD